MSAISPHLIHTLSPSSSTPMSSSSNINSSNTSTSQSPLSRPEFSYVPPPEAYPDSQRKIGLRHRAGTIATLAEQTALRKLVRHASLRWVDGGAVYIDRATGSYWEITGPLLAHLRERRHAQTSRLVEERLAAFQAQLNGMTSSQVEAAAQQAKLDTDMVMKEGRRRGDPSWRPEGFVDFTPSAMAEVQRRGILCGPLEDREILTGLDSWFESQTPTISPAGGHRVFSPSTGM